MSSSSRLHAADSDSSKVDLPVFITPHELVFSASKRRTILVIYNPYGNDAQFKIMTTNPDRYDVSQTKGTIKPNRRIDITIRLVSGTICELPEPTDEPQLIDHFKISVQVASLRGSRQLRVHWGTTADQSDNDGDDNSTAKSVRLRRALLKQTGFAGSSPSASTSSVSLSPGPFASASSQRIQQQQQQQQEQQQQHGAMPILGARSSAMRSARSQFQEGPANRRAGHHNGSNVNLVCFLGAILCVVLLFLPLAIDSELCKRAKLYSSASPDSSPGAAQGEHSSVQALFGRLSELLSVSYEMKFGCSFALGLFTYRLISTMPD